MEAIKSNPLDLPTKSSKNVPNYIFEKFAKPTGNLEDIYHGIPHL